MRPPAPEFHENAGGVDTETAAEVLVRFERRQAAIASEAGSGVDILSRISAAEADRRRLAVCSSGVDSESRKIPSACEDATEARGCVCEVCSGIGSTSPRIPAESLRRFRSGVPFGGGGRSWVSREVGLNAGAAGWSDVFDVPD